MHLVHAPHLGGKHRVERSQPAVCPDCGHPGVAVAGSPLGRLVHRVRPSHECHYAMYEYSVLRDESCGCRSHAHVG